MNINIENYKIFRVCRTLLRIFQINVYPYSCEDYFYLRLQRVWQYTRDVMFQLTHNGHGRTDVTIIISTLREIYIIALSIAWIFELCIFLRNSHRELALKILGADINVFYLKLWLFHGLVIIIINFYLKILIFTGWNLFRIRLPNDTT